MSHNALTILTNWKSQTCRIKKLFTQKLTWKLISNDLAIVVMINANYGMKEYNRYVARFDGT